MPRKPKTNYTTNAGDLNLKDLFQTPGYALDPLIPYLRRLGFPHVWEPAAGEGYLTRALRLAGFAVTAHDLQHGRDYFAADPVGDVQVTNVPFGVKYQWIERAVANGHPFALLMPSDVLFAGSKFQPLMKRYDLQMLIPDKRINFKTPIQGWAGSAAQMHTSWVCRGLALPDRVTFCEVTPRTEPPMAESDWVCRLDPALIARLQAEEAARKAKG
jgi:hypothetical protein